MRRPLPDLARGAVRRSNASLGLLLYVLLATGMAGWPTWVLTVMVVPAVAMSTFLAWSLLSRGLQCRICWAGTSPITAWGIAVDAAVRSYCRCLKMMRVTPSGPSHVRRRFAGLRSASLPEIQSSPRDAAYAPEVW